MSDADQGLSVVKSIVVLRRALRSHPSSDPTKPKLPVAQVQVLVHLAQTGPLTMGALAEQLGVSCPAATDLIDRLVAAGKVERVVSTQDRRKVLVQMTPEAQAMGEGILAARRAQVDDVLWKLTASERVGFVRGLELLANSLAVGAGVALADSPMPVEDPRLVAAVR